MNIRERIARRAALELTDGEYVNLGFGIPNLVPNFLPPDVEVVLETENGGLAFGPTPFAGEADPGNGNAAGFPISLVPGSACFDLADSFGMIRGGHIDTAILGALEVDQKGNIANWAMNAAAGDLAPGMGGAMDLVVGVKNIVATLQHNDKRGASKVLKECTLALTGVAVVRTIVTDKAVFRVTPDGLVLLEKDPEFTVEHLRSCTDADFVVSPDLCDYRMSGINA